MKGRNKIQIGIMAIALLIIVGLMGAIQQYDNQLAELHDQFNGKFGFNIHCYVHIDYADGRTFDYHHAGTLTDIGKDFIEAKLADSTYANVTKYCLYISLSTSASAPASNWLSIPSEITTNGLERALATYTNVGVGIWTVVKQFTASNTHTNVQLAGLCWDSYATSYNGNLLCADTFTAVTLNNGDKITLTWSLSDA